MSQPVFWYRDDVSGALVWRNINSEVWYNDLGTWRRAKELWYNDLGTWRQVYVYGFSLFLLSNTTVYGPACSTPGNQAIGFAQMSFQPDGTVTTRYTDNTGAFLQGSILNNWARPVIADGSGGAAYQIRLTLAAQSPWSGTPVSGTWYPLSSPVTVSISGFISGTTIRTSTFYVDIRRVVDGVIVCSATMSVSAQSQYTP